MGFKDRLRRALSLIKEDMVTLRCTRCGWELETPDEVPLVLFDQAMADFDEERSRDALDAAALDAVLAHPCVEDAAEKPWSFTEIDSTGGGSLAQLAAVFRESHELAYGEKKPDDT